MIVVAGPRQVGKTIMVQRVMAERRGMFVATEQTSPESMDPFDPRSSAQSAIAIAGSPPNEEWLIRQWTQARSRAAGAAAGETFVLAIDEIQKIPRWSEVVKGLWDADRAARLPLHVVLLGSSPWLLQKGLTESLAGRFETIRLAHWSYPEMQAAFDVSLDEYIYFGGYPGSGEFIRNESRWRQYIRDSLIDTHMEKDVLQMRRVEKRDLLRSLFELGCGAYSGQIVALDKLKGQLKDAGNVVTLADYLQLLSRAGLLTGLQMYSGAKHRQRASRPKLNVHNTALMAVLSGYDFAAAKADRTFWGRLVESAVGAHLINTASAECAVQYWRESPHEVDFVLSKAKSLTAIEVKSGERHVNPRGLAEFKAKYRNARDLIVGVGGIPLAEFLSGPADDWLG